MDGLKMRIEAPTLGSTTMRERGIIVPSACPEVKLRQDRNISTVVGGSFLGTGDVGTKFTWTNGATSTLGVAVSAANQVFHAGGSRTVTDSLATSFQVRNHGENTLYRSEFTYVLTRNCANYQTYRPVLHEGGASTQATNYPGLPYCNQYEPGTSVVKDTGRSHQFSGGVSAGSKVGINLSSLTGHSRSASLTYFSNYSRGWFLCGERTAPGGDDAGFVGAVAAYPGGCSLAPLRPGTDLRQC